MIIIPDTLKDRLKHSPEYGMGFQVARLKLSTGNYESGIILNGTVFLKTDEVETKTYEVFLEEAIKAASRRTHVVTDATLTTRPPSSLRLTRKIGEQTYFSAANQAAQSAPITATASGEIFKRFSAYPNDIRITERRGLTAGTFATTDEDAKNVHTGMEAIVRYALKNKESANKVFTISPPNNTDLQKGVVQPAYGEPGGGVEVIFVNGSPDYSVDGPQIISQR